jgi:hypothetical protein
MRVLLLLFLLLSMVKTADAVDAEREVTKVEKNGDWQIIEFAGHSRLLYRISSTSINSHSDNIVFDFGTADGCRPTPATLITDHKSYQSSLSNGVLIIAYKVPGEEDNVELVKTFMAKSDRFVFITFQKLTTERLLRGKEAGRLAIWIPGSGDGSVKRSSNIYFSLDGFAHAYQRATSQCTANQ